MLYVFDKQIAMPTANPKIFMKEKTLFANWAQLMPLKFPQDKEIIKGPGTAFFYFSRLNFGELSSSTICKKEIVSN